jgi:hypothetical protein
MGRVQVSHDIVFNEDACWDWKGEQKEDPLDFTIDPIVNTFPGFASVIGPRTREITPLGAQTPVQAHSPASTPGPPSRSPFPATSTASTGPTVELVSPPSRVEEMLDADDDVNAAHRFRTISNILGAVQNPGAVTQEQAMQVCLADTEEPVTLEEAQAREC